MDLTNFKLAICVPISWTHVHVQFLESFVAMDKPQNFIFLRSGTGRIDEMRNKLVMAAKNYGASHILFLDSDHKFRPDTIKKLLSHNLPIVGGLSFMRTPPYDPVMLLGDINNYKTITEWGKDSLVEVDATGAACLLINMEVFEKMQYPYFHFMKNPDPDIPFTIGEDVVFCRKAKDLGYKIYVDTSLPNKHIGQIEVGEEEWRRWNYDDNSESISNIESFLSTQISPEDTILNLGCGNNKYNFKYKKMIGIDAWEKLNPDYLLDLEKERIPFGKNSFNVVLMIDFIEHLTLERGFSLLEEAKDVCIDKIILMTPLWWDDNSKNVNNKNLWCYGNKYDYHKSLWNSSCFHGFKQINTNGPLKNYYVGVWDKNVASK